LAHSDAALLGNVLKLADDRTEDPENALPSWVIDGRGIGENVVGEVAAL
jgi:hypothetical protein